MRGSIVARGKGRYALVFDLGRETDPASGRTRRKQKWVAFRGTRKRAEARLTELLGTVHGGTFVEPSKMTLVAWLREWVEKAIKPPLRRPETYRVYRSVIEGHVARAPLGLLPLQRVRALDLERYYADLKLSPGTVTVHHAVLHRALKKAVKDRLLPRNPAADVEARPRVAPGHEQVRLHCWSADEARTFLTATAKAGPQAAAFFALALETGMRRGELLGLRWRDVDLEAQQVTVAQQLTRAEGAPQFGPPKNGLPRAVAIGAQVATLLRRHRQAQASVKMANRTTYGDQGLVFAREPADLQTPGARLGDPLPIGGLAGREFERLTRAAGVRRIKFHGLRHTSATLALGAGVPLHVVSQRLGHRRPEITLGVYAHALPDQQVTAAERLGALLHG